MSTKEQDVVAVLEADGTLMAILTGGVYYDEEIGIQGFHRGDDSTTDAAFNADGNLLPCAVVRQGPELAMAGIRDPGEKIVGLAQPIEIYFYQERDKDQILLARKRVYDLLEQRRLPGTYPLTWVSDSPAFYDVGPIANSTTLRQDWRCVFLRKPS